MKQYTVFLVVGKTGTGKSTLVRKLVDQFQGRVSLLAPPDQSNFADRQVDWNACECLAIDDTWLYRSAPAPAFIERCEEEALERGKKLLLVLQDKLDLEDSGIHLKSEPFMMELVGAHEAVVIEFDGERSSYTDAEALRKWFASISRLQ